MEDTKRLVFSSGDSSLPLWFTGCMGIQGKQELVLLLEPDQVVFEAGPDYISAQYVEEEGQRTGVAVLCHVMPKELSIAQLFTVGGQCIFPNPGSLDFLGLDLSGLDVCFTLISWFGEEPSYLENFIICYQDKISVIPGILEIGNAWLHITKEGISSRIVLTGEFCIGRSLPLVARLEFMAGRITAALSSPEGSFPSFFDFLCWAARKSGAEEAFGWLKEAGSLLDAALSAASLTLDTKTLGIADFMVEARVNLFGLDLDVCYYEAAGLLRGTTWQQEPLELDRLLGRLLADTGGEIPDALKGAALSGCELCVWTANKEYELAGRLDGRIAIDGLTLTGVRLSLRAGKELSLQVEGTVEFSDAWQADILFQYSQGGKSYTMTGRLSLMKPVGLPQIPFLQDLLPGKLEYRHSGIAFVYENGQIQTGSVELQMVVPKPEKQALPMDYTLTAAPDGRPELEKKEELPEEGPVRQGDGLRWFEVRRKLGPAHLDRVGIGFSDMVFSASLDGGVQLGPVDIAVLGLSVGYDMKAEVLRGDLYGLFLSCKTSGFTLSGGIFREKAEAGVRLSFSGLVSLKLAKWGLQAVASYGVMEDGSVSFFVFLNCSLRLPVLPGIFITGLMGGMGINRRFLIPAAEEVNFFPLLSMNQGRSGLQVLTELREKNALAPAPGEYWAALGMSFEACGLVHGKLLLAVLFGQEFQAAVLGSVEISLPGQAPREGCFAYLKILLSAVLRPEAGIFQAEAVFSNDSFLLSKDCHIFGQAICTMWFGSHEHSGDFVLSLGGYHPAYKVPGHYPAVKPVGFSWQINSHISAKGSAYMAVTPSCVMAGGRLEFLFTLGNLRAWFTANADLFMQWHPFYFDARIGVGVGVSYRLNLLFCHKTISVSLGANLHLWGPPIGGDLRVHILFLSFSVSFGKSLSVDKLALTWEQMRETLLPEKNLHTMGALKGIRPQQKEGAPWLCLDGALSILCETAVPAGQINIRPMNLEGIQSVWDAEVIAPDQKKGTLQEYGFTVERETKDQPGALWGRPARDIPEADMVKGLDSGYIIKAGKPELRGEIRIMNYREELVQCLTLDNPLLTPEAKRTPALYGKNLGNTIGILTRIAQEETVIRRSALCGCLGDYYKGPSGSFQRVQDEREQLYTDCPMLI